MGLLPTVFKNQPPNTALIKSGSKPLQIILGGALSAAPPFQRIDTLNLQLHTIVLHTEDGITIDGVQVDITAHCQAKIQGWYLSDTPSTSPHSKARSKTPHPSMPCDMDAIKLAAQHFIGKSDSEIIDCMKHTIKAHQRAIIATLTVQEIQEDRPAFSAAVSHMCKKDLRDMGLCIVSYTIADVLDKRGYIDALGVPAIEKVKRMAVEGRSIHQNKARSTQMQHSVATDMEINNQNIRKTHSDKACLIARAEAQADIDRHVAAQESSFAISTALQRKVLLVKKKEALEAQVRADIPVQKRLVQQRRLQKQQEVHVPADAQLYRTRKIAVTTRVKAAVEAARMRIKAEAMAGTSAVCVRKIGMAKAEVAKEKVRKKGLAEAIVAREKGMAEIEVETAMAEATRLKGLAEMEVLEQRMKAWKDRFVFVFDVSFSKFIWVSDS